MTKYREGYPTDKGRTLRTGRQTKPESGDRKQLIARVDELTASARKSWIGLISYLAFVSVTLLGVRDADFFIPERQTELPLIGVSIPTALFFGVAPALGASLYIYFHLQLIRVWDAMAEALKAVPTDDLIKALSPWLVTEFALLRRSGAHTDDRPLRLTATTMARMSAFWAGPVILFFFWLRSLPAKDEWLTILFCGVPLIFAIRALIKSSRHMNERMRPEFRPSATRRGLRTAGAWLAILAFTVLGWLATEGGFDNYAREIAEGLEKEREKDRRANPEQTLTDTSRDWWIDYLNNPTDKWWGDRLNFLVLSFGANLANVDFVDADEKIVDYVEARLSFRLNWCRVQGIPPQACGLNGQAQPANQSAFLWGQRQRWCEGTLSFDDGDTAACRQRFEELEEMFASAWFDHRRKTLSGLTARDLSDQDLRKANLIGARLEGANLTEARLDQADMRRARLEGARLQEAQFRGTDFRRTWMEGVNLTGAQFDEDTIFCPITLRGAVLRKTDLSRPVRYNEQYPFVEAFGDTSVTLPDTHVAGQGPLRHWIDEDLDWTDPTVRTGFTRRSEEWERELGDEMRTFAKIRDRVDCPERLKPRRSGR
jgi:hypothetical protein